MTKFYINEVEYTTNEDISILEFAHKNGIEIPSLCFMKDCGNTSKCGVCSVQILKDGKAMKRLACGTKIEEGMSIITDSEEVKEAQKARVVALLNKHEFKCGTCVRKTTCEFLKLVIKTKAKADAPFVPEDPQANIDDRSESITIDRNKCLLCGRCEATCKVRTTTGSIAIQKGENGRQVGPTGEGCFDDTNCILCGQCVAACPVAALKETNHIDRVKAALADESKHVIIAMAPAVRTSLGELFNLPIGTDVTGKAYTAMRELGFDKVFDIDFAADVTIMEEGTELLTRVKEGGKFPMFTSCCPGWVRLVENYFPQYLDHLSTAKSPQQMFGATAKSYYADLTDIDPKDIYVVTVMPCIAKKHEAARPGMENDGLRNVDAVITTREFARMVQEAKIPFAKLDEGVTDPAMGEYTGAGALFGTTGGVMEAALRTAKDVADGVDLQDVDYQAVRGLQGIKEATITLGGAPVKVAVVNGTKYAFELFESGKLDEYQFVEVMACTGGCVNGGGQAHVSATTRMDIDIRTERAKVLYNEDAVVLPKRKSHENESVKKMYEKFMGEPNHGNAHKYLHYVYTKK
ncbi:MAG: [FeFe] hydrogenase, group A [Lactobacillales bacterium]|jgi:iron-only hydrogenase group A|nr:[FeFe] hydrogenase, group A [Lactobacillales bacterium]